MMEQLFLTSTLDKNFEKMFEQEKLEGPVPVEPRERPFIEELIPRWLTVGMETDTLSEEL